MVAYKGKDFLTFDSFYDRNVFIVVFEAVDPVIDNWEYFYRKSIKQYDFCYF